MMRRGAALPTALIAVTVLASLTAGALLAGRQTRRASRDVLPRLRASVGAEGALAAALAQWPARWRQLAVGVADSLVPNAPTASFARVTLVATRLDARHVLVEANALARASQPRLDAERVSAVVARLDPPIPALHGAISIGGALRVMQQASVDGRDVVPNGWTGCPVAGPDSAAIVAPDTSLVTLATGGSITGRIVTASTAALDPASLSFGGETWNAVASRAIAIPNGVVTPAAQSSAGVCTLAPDAWSDPSHAIPECANAYALVVAKGALTVRGPARGQGMLVVDGDLTVDGAFDFDGVIVVRGALHADLGALRLTGALIVGAGPSTLGPGSTVRWSRCATMRATDGVARISVMRRRSWTEVTR